VKTLHIGIFSRFASRCRRGLRPVGFVYVRWLPSRDPALGRHSRLSGPAVKLREYPFVRAKFARERTFAKKLA
jgi:hypothetical protein